MQKAQLLIKNKKKKKRIYFFLLKANPLPTSNRAETRGPIGKPVSCIGTVLVVVVVTACTVVPPDEPELELLPVEPDPEPELEPEPEPELEPSPEPSSVEAGTAVTGKEPILLSNSGLYPETESSGCILKVPALKALKLSHKFGSPTVTLPKFHVKVLVTSSYCHVP